MAEATFTAPGPLKRTIPTPPSPGGVEMATIVSSVLVTQGAYVNISAFAATGKLATTGTATATPTTAAAVTAAGAGSPIGTHGVLRADDHAAE